MRKEGSTKIPLEATTDKEGTANEENFIYCVFRCDHMSGANASNGQFARWHFHGVRRRDIFPEM